MFSPLIFRFLPTPLRPLHTEATAFGPAKRGAIVYRGNSHTCEVGNLIYLPGVEVSTDDTGKNDPGGG